MTGKSVQMPFNAVRFSILFGQLLAVVSVAIKGRAPERQVVKRCDVSPTPDHGSDDSMQFIVDRLVNIQGLKMSDLGRIPRFEHVLVDASHHDSFRELQSQFKLRVHRF